MTIQLNQGANTAGPEDFAVLVDLQQQHSRLSANMGDLDARMNHASQNAIADDATSYVVLQEDLAKVEDAIKVLFDRNPAWRGDSKSVTTPYGSVEQRSSTKLEVPNEAMTVALIVARGREDSTFRFEDFLHIERKPNLEALERFDDALLAKLGVNRVKTESVTVKPAKVNAEKRTKAAKKKLAAAPATKS